MTRRELLAALVAATAARADSGAKMSHISAINDEIGLTFDETVAFAKQYGIQWVELRSAQVPGKLRYCETLAGADLRDFRKRLDDSGLRASVLDSSLLKSVLPGTVSEKREDFYVRYFAEMGLDDAALFRNRLDMLKRTIDVAHGLGTREIRVFSFWRVTDPTPHFPKIADVLAEMADIAAKENCRLLIENEGSCNVATSAETAEILRLVPSKGLGLNYDPQNSMPIEAQPFPEGYAKLPKNRIGNVHVKAEGLFGPKRPLDWGAIMHAMLSGGYIGRFSLETHRGHNSDNVKASHQCMEKMIGLLEAV